MLKRRKKEASYAVSQEDGVTVISLAGEIDLKSSPQARAQILALLAEGHQLLVDLSDTAYIDSSGVASLVEGLQAAQQRGALFGLVSVSKAARQVLELARLDTVFTIHANVAAAQAVLAEQSS